MWWLEPRRTIAIAWVRSALLLALAVLVVALAWAPGLTAPYQYDDYVTPVKDPASQSIGAFFHALPRTLRPLTKLSYALESSAGAIDAPARRGLNSLLFLASAGLLALLARASGLERGLAAALAVLWAVHPVHAEMVLALAGRSVLLSTCLVLASAVLLARERPLPGLVLAVCAVLARETACAWLVASVALLVWRAGIPKWRVAAALMGAFSLGGLLTLMSARLRELLVFSWSDPDSWNRLGLQWAALPHGVRLLFFDPDAFTVDMEFRPSGPLRLAYILAAGGAYACAAWLALRAKSRPALRLAALLWLSFVVPLHSVIPKLDPLTARSFAASSAALIALLAATVVPQDGAARTRGEPAVAGAGGSRRARAVFGIAVGLCICVLVPVTRSRAALYADPIALWRDAAEKSRIATRPLVNLGTLLAQNGDLVEARRTLEQAVRRNPRSREATERLAAVNVLIEARKLLTTPGPP